MFLDALQETDWLEIEARNLFTSAGPGKWPPPGRRRAHTLWLLARGAATAKETPNEMQTLETFPLARFDSGSLPGRVRSTPRLEALFPFQVIDPSGKREEEKKTRSLRLLAGLTRPAQKARLH